MSSGDEAVLAAWWREFCEQARLTIGLELVHGRLVRSVHRGVLPSGPVHVKAMAFPRAKDKLRYLLRALPAAHEAAMLGVVARAGVPCPEVVAVRTARSRSRGDSAAGVVHHDLHGGNFVRLVDGRLAVLDLQSAHVVAPARASAPGVRVALAARMLRERDGLGDDEGLAELIATGFLASRAVAEVRRRLRRERLYWQRTRLLRCLGESSEFRRRWRLSGCEHWHRGAEVAGRWCARPDARAAWLGQRLQWLEQGREPRFPAFLRKWWWLGGRGALYVPATCHDGRVDAEVQAAVADAARANRIVAGVDAEAT